jgi:ATP synthase protein I
MEVAVADREKPSDLEERRRVLDAALAARRPKGSGEGKDAEKGGAGEYGKALRLSSEFIAGIVVGAGLGWFIDRMAGTSPWGLIVFLLLGFGAGILNVLRSAGQIAEFGSRPSKDDDDLQGR